MESNRLVLITKDSSFITSLIAGTDFRRKLVADGIRKRTAADDVSDSGDRLVELVNECFWASIHVEEGRSVTGTICICSPEQAPLARAFDKPVLLSAKKLVALFTASPQSSLAVHKSGNELVVWGLLDAEPMFSLRIRVADTGTVVASVDRRVLAVLERGETHIPNIGAGEIDWIMLVAKSFDQTKSFEDRMRLAARFLRVVTAMHRQGHGGALVVVPVSSGTWEENVNFAFRFDSESSLAICRRLQELQGAEEVHECLEQRQTGGIPLSPVPVDSDSIRTHRQLLDSLLGSVGALSAIDGAVVMDEELKVLGFGAKLHSVSGAFEVIVLDALSGMTEGLPYGDLGGTRHQSAARFVHSNHETMVFVASQDGRLTLFAWVIKTEKVVAIRRLEHLVWDYPL